MNATKINNIFEYFKRMYNKESYLDKYYVSNHGYDVYLNLRKTTNQETYDNKVSFVYTVPDKELTLYLFYKFSFYIENIFTMNKILKVNEYRLVNNDNLIYKNYTYLISRLLPFYIPIHKIQEEDNNERMKIYISNLLEYTNIKEIKENGKNYVAFFENLEGGFEFFEFKFQEVDEIDSSNFETYNMIEDFIDTLLYVKDGIGA